MVGATYGGDVDFPTTAGALDTTHNGGNDGFVTKLNPAGSGLAFSTFLGGSRGTGRDGVQRRRRRCVGRVRRRHDRRATGSRPPPAPTTVRNGNEAEAFVAKLDLDGESLLYSTYLGGSGNDVGNGIAVDASGNAFVTGATSDAASRLPDDARGLRHDGRRR